MRDLLQEQSIPGVVPVKNAERSQSVGGGFMDRRKRKGLRTTLAEIIDDVLGMPPKYALTLKNVRDYCDHRSITRQYGIRDTTELTEMDWLIALQICREDRRNHFYRKSVNDQTPRKDRYFDLYNKMSFTELKSTAKTTTKNFSLYS